MTKVLIGLRHLFDGADAELYTLPDPVIQLRRAVALLAEYDLPAPPAAMVVLDGLVEQTRQAAKDGQPLPDAAPVLAAEEANKAYEHQRRILNDAGERTENELLSVAAANADTIISVHLRPAHDAVVARLAEAAKLTTQYPDARSALTAGAKVRAAVAELPSLCQVHGAILVARAALTRLPGCQPAHPDSPTSWIANAEEIWPSENWGRGRPPWPEGPDGLLFLVRNGAKLWMPTAAEEDRAFEETSLFAALVQAQRNRANLQGMRQIYQPSAEKLAGTAEGRNPIAAGLAQGDAPPDVVRGGGE